MAVSTPDAPSLGAVYKLVALEDASGKLVAVQKRAGAKGSSAAPKQVFRTDGRDVIAVEGESHPGEALLQPIGEMDLSLEAARARLVKDLAEAPAQTTSIAPRHEGEGFPVRRSAALDALHARVDREGRVTL